MAHSVKEASYRRLRESLAFEVRFAQGIVVLLSSASSEPGKSCLRCWRCVLVHSAHLGPVPYLICETINSDQFSEGGSLILAIHKALRAVGTS